MRLVESAGRRRGIRGRAMKGIAKLALVLLLATSAWTFAVPALAASQTLPPLTPSKHDALYRALAHGKLTEPQYALERARSLFARALTGRRWSVPTRSRPSSRP